MSTQSTYEIMDRIEKQSGKNAKEQILKDNINNMEFREALVFLLNPFVVTGISTKKMNKKIEKEVSLTTLADLPSLMSYLENNKSGRDLDVLTIQAFIEKLETEELKTFVKKFVTKDLKLGISEKTVNKVYGKGTIPSFSVMLAESYEKKQDKVTGKFYISLKLDGNRCVAINEPSGVKFFSRKGQQIEGMTMLEEQFKELPTGMVYDGELLLVNKDNLPSDQLFRATQKVVRKDGEKKDLELHVFDGLPIEEFKTGKSKKTYEQRRNTLDLMFGRLNDGLIQFIKLLPVMYVGEDKSAIITLASAVEAEGFEGLMINTADGLYESKRVAVLLKVKSFKSADLLCMGLEEGTGRNEGRLGAILVEYKGGITRIGTGFSDEQRDYLWNNPDEIVGKIIETKFFEESMDEKTRQVSLRFPVFVCVRTDKGVDDIRYE
jgi:DNA ligase-1